MGEDLGRPHPDGTDDPHGTDAEETPAGGVDDQVGSVADETGRLLAALGDWARDQGPGLGAGVAAAAAAAADAARQVGEHVDAQRTGDGTHEPHDGGDPACTWCPLCRALAVVRSASPEVRAQLGVAATALLQAGAGLLAGLGVEPPAGERDRGPTGAAAGPGVERIDLDPPDLDPPDDYLPGGGHCPGDDDCDGKA